MARRHLVYMDPFGWLGLDLTAAKVDWGDARNR